jgi:hypothetical protein
MKAHTHTRMYKEAVSAVLLAFASLMGACEQYLMI